LKTAMGEKFIVPMSKPNLGKNEKKSITEVLNSDWVSEGQKTQLFQKKLERYLKSDSIVVNNGSAALMASLIANDFKAGDKVIVPAFTFVATSSIPKILGGKIIVADVDPNTFNVNPEILEKILKKNKVKFVIVVDVGGLPVDIDGIKKLSKKYNFILIEDAAQSFGAMYKNKKLGSFDHLTGFSFQIAKQLTTIEGGLVASNNKKLMNKIKKIKDYGRTSKLYEHDTIGTNFRTTDIQSAIGIEQLKKVEEHIENRNKIASKFKKFKQFEFQEIPSFVTRHSYMIFFVKAKNKIRRDQCLKKLNKHGIDARKSWLPIHLQPCNTELKNSKCSNAELIYNQIFTLPLFNNMKNQEVEKIIKIFGDLKND
jgi:perosamine synthetase